MEVLQIIISIKDLDQKYPYSAINDLIERFALKLATIVPKFISVSQCNSEHWEVGTYFRDGRLFEGDAYLMILYLGWALIFEGVAYSSHHGMSLFAW